MMQADYRNSIDIDVLSRQRCSDIQFPDHCASDTKKQDSWGRRLVDKVAITRTMVRTYTYHPFHPRNPR